MNRIVKQKFFTLLTELFFWPTLGRKQSHERGTVGIYTRKKITQNYGVNSPHSWWQLSLPNTQRTRGWPDVTPAGSVGVYSTLN